VIVNFRPEYRVPWATRSFYRQIALAPLGDEPLGELLTALLGDDRSLAEPARLIRERTAGNPFFVEELVRALAEAGSLEGERGAYRLAAPVTGASVPSSVQAVLAARIDRLAARDKAVLQAAAVIGKEFAAGVLERVAELDAGELVAALQALRAGEFVDEREPEPEALYAFRHPLTREVAYDSQLRERRARVHAAVARAIAELYPERLNERAALVAQHWEAAGAPLEAAHWYARAAVWAGTGDPAQALGHWTKVRELADTLPDAPEHLSLRLTARMYAMQFGWRLGVSQAQARAAFEEAEQLAVRLGDVRARAVLLNGYGAVRGVGDGEVREFARLQRQALALAEESADPMLYMAIVPGAYAFFCTGDLREALASCDRALELADGDLSVGAGINYACPYAWCYGFKGVLVALLGDLAEAGRLIGQARRFAEQQGDLEVVGFSELNAAYLAYFLGEPAALLRHARESLAIADRIGNAFARTYAQTLVGVARGLRGEWAEAVAAHQDSIEIARAGRLGVEEESRLAVLGEACLGAGDARRARALVEEALPMARQRGNVWSQMLCSVSWARVLLATGGAGEAARIETELRRILGLALRTGAKAVEPLVRVELAELARRRGDEVGRARELRQAHRLFTDIGAGGHAARLEADQAASTH
jgi:adenylate cyclase